MAWAYALLQVSHIHQPDVAEELRKALDKFETP
jgi:hypothetical protein